jgi:hypothetical protein
LTRLDQKVDIAFRIRHKFKRWRLDILPGHIAGRVSRSLQVISASCRPCVVATLWRTMWNGWPTAARMRSLTGTGEGRCALGCDSGKDRIEHYAVCPLAWRFLGAPKPIGLGMGCHLRSLAGFLTVAHGMTDAEKTDMAVAVYAVARTVHSCRDSPGLKPLPLLRMHAKFGQR